MGELLLPSIRENFLHRNLDYNCQRGKLRPENSNSRRIMHKLVTISFQVIKKKCIRFKCGQFSGSHMCKTSAPIEEITKFRRMNTIMRTSWEKVILWRKSVKGHSKSVILMWTLLVNRNNRTLGINVKIRCRESQWGYFWWVFLPLEGIFRDIVSTYLPHWNDICFSKNHS